MINLATELGATTTVFSSDGHVRRCLKAQGREDARREIRADPDAADDEIGLSRPEPLIALPRSLGNGALVAASDPVDILSHAVQMRC